MLCISLPASERMKEDLRRQNVASVGGEGGGHSIWEGWEVKKKRRGRGTKRE